MKHAPRLLLPCLTAVFLLHGTVLARDPNERLLIEQAVKAIDLVDEGQTFERFLAQRTAPLSPDRRAYYKNELFNRPDLAHNRLFDSDTPEARALFEIVRPVLDRYHWLKSIEVVVLEQKAPFFGLYRESILVVTTSVLNTLTPAQIRAFTAHELAHECFIDELIAADRANDIAAHHLVEYKCDLIAALALRGLGEDPFSLVDGIAKIERYYQNNKDLRPDTSCHPLSQQRRECLRLFLSAKKS